MVLRPVIFDRHGQQQPAHIAPELNNLDLTVGYISAHECKRESNICDAIFQNISTMNMYRAKTVKAYLNDSNQKARTTFIAEIAAK